MSPWWTVLAGALACGVGTGIIVAYMWGIFAQQISAELGWDRTIPALCLTCFLLATGFGALTFGAAIARFGIRRSGSAPQ